MHPTYTRLDMFLVVSPYLYAEVPDALDGNLIMSDGATIYAYSVEKFYI